MEAFLEFEKPIATLERKLQDLRDLSAQGGMNLSSEIASLEKKVAELIDETYSRLTSWQKVQLSRHPNRPYTRDYLDALFPDFMELHGDRAFGDDPAIVCGTATWRAKPDAPASTVMILGHQKGRTTKEKIQRNFGMARPEGYRKAMRAMNLAERARMPILAFIDTPGAYPGMDAEERGQSQAIAESITLMTGLTVPIICVVIGEGGSGGALAIGVGNRVLMQEYSTYSVISPESCASILWSDSSLAERASNQLKMNPPDLRALGVIDGIIPEPKGGAHRDWPGAFQHVREAIADALETYAGATQKKGKRAAWDAKAIQEERFAKFRAMGAKAIVSVTGENGAGHAEAPAPAPKSGPKAKTGSARKARK